MRSSANADSTPSGAGPASGDTAGVIGSGASSWPGSASHRLTWYFTPGTTCSARSPKYGPLSILFSYVSPSITNTSLYVASTPPPDSSTRASILRAVQSSGTSRNTRSSTSRCFGRYALRSAPLSGAPFSSSLIATPGFASTFKNFTSPRAGNGSNGAPVDSSPVVGAPPVELSSPSSAPPLLVGVAPSSSPVVPAVAESPQPENVVRTRVRAGMGCFIFCDLSFVCGFSSTLKPGLRAGIT
jgi:hypothetical protein